jgi:hypothetical protein
MSDATTQSDFFFLENVLQTVDGGKRLLKELGATAGGGTSSLVMAPKQPDDDGADEESHAKRQKTSLESLPPKWRRLVQQALERKVTLLLMPPGMERHKSNTTHFHTKSEILYWKVEFIFHAGGETKPITTLVSNKVSEESKLIEEWNKYAQKMEVNEKLHFLLKKLPCPSNKPQYVELDKDSTLKQALQGMTVIEYPTIVVVAAIDLHKFPRLIQEVDSLS